MSYYFTKSYNWFYDIHPNRPTEKEIRQKWILTEQIKKTTFKFKNREKVVPVVIKELPIINYDSLNEKVRLLNLIRNKTKVNRY